LDLFETLMDFGAYEASHVLRELGRRPVWFDEVPMRTGRCLGRPVRRNHAQSSYIFKTALGGNADEND
jgi:hypothetical protein